MCRLESTYTYTYTFSTDYNLILFGVVNGRTSCRNIVIFKVHWIGRRRNWKRASVDKTFTLDKIVKYEKNHIHTHILDYRLLSRCTYRSIWESCSYVASVYVNTKCDDVREMGPHVRRTLSPTSEEEEKEERRKEAPHDNRPKWIRYDEYVHACQVCRSGKSVDGTQKGIL